MIGRSVAATLLVVASLHATAAADAAGGGAEAREPGGAADEASLREASSTLTDAMQGQDGVRIQTLCTHCNSANVQVGGLSRDLAPILRDGFPLLGGLATSMVLSILPPDTVANVDVRRGPRAGGAPSAAAGGVIELTGATPQELPWIDLQALGGSFDRLGGSARVAGSLGARVSGSLVVGTDSTDPIDADGDGFHDVGAVEREFADGRLDLALGDHALVFGGSWIRDDTLEGRGAVDFPALLSNPNAPATWTREDSLVESAEARAGWVWRLGRGRTLEARVLGLEREQSQRSHVTALANYPAWMQALDERLRIDETSRWVAIRYSHPVGQRWRLAARLDGLEEHVVADTINLGSVSRPIERGIDHLDQLAATAQVQWLSPASRWELGGELRRDDAEWSRREADTTLDAVLPRRRSDNDASWRFTARLRPDDAWTFRLVAGETYRAPRSVFREVCCGQRYQRSTLADTEQGRTVGIEAAFQPSPWLRTSLYVARSEFDDHLFRVVGWSEFFTQTYTVANIEETRADTAEAAVRWSPLRRLTLDGSMGWLSHHNRGPSLVQIPVVRFATVQVVERPFDRVPYEPVRSGSLSATYTLQRGAALTGRADYTGSMLVQQFQLLFSQTQNGLLAEPRATPGFWLVGLSFRVPLREALELTGAVENLTDRVQNDLGDPTTDYNWGPLAGRSWRLGLRYRLDR